MMVFDENNLTVEQYLHLRQQGEGNPVRPVLRAPVRRDDPPPQRRQYAGPGGRHGGPESGGAHCGGLPYHPVRGGPPPAAGGPDRRH